MQLHVTDATTGAVVVARGRIASNPWTRLVGLMGRRELPAGDGLLITRCKSIHTSFMRFPIDVLFVGADDRVVDLVEAMPAWRARLARGKAHYVIELPAGTIARAGIAAGHQLVVKK
ncbi:MAG: DUF192 domain-containing protein [Ardenticatenaceae bacterium]|nr:DUF192 domain-containing protein [Ardenticatenaceae bacterium]HBY98701.1 DUF192 domain-containing protein [Chloroflexota bacterium]